MHCKKLLFILPVLIFSNLAEGQSLRLINTRDTYPSASPDGSLIVFQSNRSGTDQIYIMKTADGSIRKLAEFPLGAETPMFSPDGKKIVFDVYVAENNNDVFTINVDGSDLKQLTDSPGYDGHPHWSADGQRIVFNSDRTSPDKEASWSDRWHEIFSMNSDGSDVKQHSHCKSVCTYGGFSPDGKKVLYRSVIKGVGLNWGLDSIEKNSEIFISDTDGENAINLTRNAAFDGWPVWSPDGKQIAFASNRSGPALAGQIWLMDVEGASLKQLSHGPWSHAQPAWASDGLSIYAYQFKETKDHEFGSVVQIKLQD